MSVTMSSPSGEVLVVLPALSRGRWKIAHRGQVLAQGRGYRTLTQALGELAERLDRDGLGVAAGELRAVALELT